MNRTIQYVMSHPPHLPYLIVSLWTLRKHWDGRIVVSAWPESYDFVKRIARDGRLRIECRQREPDFRGKNSQFLDKIKAMQCLDCETALYLDADTIVNGPVTHLFDSAEMFGFCATQFNDWLSNSGMPRKRIKRLLGREGIDQESVRLAIKGTLPSVNGGVFAARPSSYILECWYCLTMKVKDIFIADETVLHAIVADPNNSGRLLVAGGGYWNCAPKFQPKYMKDEDVRIWHFHGDSNCRPNKCPRGIYLWWHHYQECLILNVGGLADWKDGCRTKHLTRLENRPENLCLYCGHLNETHSKKCPLVTSEELT